MPVRPPSGTVTFLFTGIQDFLRRWDEAPAEMAAAQRVHDRIVREAIEGHGGHVFGTDGDGFRAAFATALSAAEAAVDAQRALRADTRAVARAQNSHCVTPCFAATLRFQRRFETAAISSFDVGERTVRRIIVSLLCIAQTDPPLLSRRIDAKIGRASCRERVYGTV